MSSATAALLKLPSSATCTKYSSCLRFMGRHSLLLNSSRLDHLSPLLDIGFQSGRYLLRRTCPGLNAKFEKPPFHFAFGKDFLQRAIECLEDFRWRAGRSKQSIPGDHVVIGDAAFPQGWNIRRTFRAYRTRRAERPYFLVEEIALHRRVAVDHQSEVALHGGHQKLRRASIRNDRKIDAGGGLEQLCGQVLSASNIDRSHIERAWLCLGSHDEVRQRFEFRLRGGRENEIKETQTGNRVEIPQR